MTMKTTEALSYINASLKGFNTRMDTFEEAMVANTKVANENTEWIEKSFIELEKQIEANKLPTIVDNDGVIQLTQDAMVTEYDEFKKEIRGKLDSLQAQIHQLLADLEDNGGRPRRLTHNQLVDAVREMSPDDGTTWSPVSRD